MGSQIASDVVLSRFRAALAETYGDRLERVVLFGSRARGDARPDSDYDIAVFIREPNRWFDEVIRLADLPLALIVTRHRKISQDP